MLLAIIAGAILDVGPGLGLLGDSLMPWLGLWVAVPLVTTVLTRRRGPLLATAGLALVWVLAFVPTITPLPTGTPSVGTLTVVSQNVRTGGPAVAASAEAAAQTGADLIAFEELDAPSHEAAGALLTADYGYYFGTGTVALWSRYPIGSKPRQGPSAST
jgi:vancomycin resistance protein VanJ